MYKYESDLFCYREQTHDDALSTGDARIRAIELLDILNDKESRIDDLEEELRSLEKELAKLRVVIEKIMSEGA